MYLFLVFLGNNINFCFDGTLNVTLGTCPVEDSAQIYQDYCPTKTEYSWTIITGHSIPVNSIRQKGSLLSIGFEAKMDQIQV